MERHTYFRNRYNVCFLKVVIGIFILNKEEQLRSMTIVQSPLESVLSSCSKISIKIGRFLKCVSSINTAACISFTTLVGLLGFLYIEGLLPSGCYQY